MAINQNNDNQKFFDSTGYQKSFIVDTCHELIAKQFDENSELTFTAFWDSTTLDDVVRVVNEVCEDIYLVLLSNLYTIKNPRLFEITAGILANLLTNKTYTKIKPDLAGNFLDLLEGIFTIDIGVPECFIQVVRVVHISFSRFRSGINFRIFVDPCLFLLSASAEVELIKAVIDLLYTVQEYASSDVNANEAFESYPIQPFLEALKELKIEELLKYDTPALIFENNHNKELIDFYTDQIKVAKLPSKLPEFIEVSDLLRDKLKI